MQQSPLDLKYGPRSQIRALTENTHLLNQTLTPLPRTLSSLERALLRLLVTGYVLEDAAKSVGLSLPEAEDALRELQCRCGVSCLPRLLALAILKSWV